MNIYPISVAMVRSVHSQVMPAIRGDRELSGQLHRACRSVVLNIAEGLGVDRGKRRDQHFRIALGSARESMACIDLALATGLVGERSVADAVDRVDHVCAILWKLTRR